MMTPKITWYVLEDIDGVYEYSQKRTHDMEGSYAPNDIVRTKIQLWNNRLGSEDVQNAKNAKLSVFFKNYEDNYMLKLCKVKFNDEEPKALEIDMDRGLFELGSISGGANNGSDLNTDNYVEFELMIGPLPSNLKSELKGLVLDVEYEE